MLKISRYEVVGIKRLVLISAAVLLLLSLVGCVSPTVTDVDSFITAFNSLSETQISKSDFCGFSEDGKISHCFMIGDTLVSLNSDEETMKIFSADAVTEKQPDEEYKNAVKLMLSSLTTLSDEDVRDAVSKLVSTSGGFYRTATQTHDYYLSFVSVDAGSKFTVKFNELVPTETTKIPVTRQEYTDYSTIPEFTG